MGIGKGLEVRVKRGISELLAIVLGIVITIAIGVMFYMFMPNFMTTLIQQQRIGITQLSSSVLNDGSAIVSLSIKNLGTKAIKEINLTAVDLSLTVLSPTATKIYGADSSSVHIDLRNSTILPGQELSVILRLRSKGKPITSGTKVSLIIVAKFVDESTTSLATSLAIV